MDKLKRITIPAVFTLFGILFSCISLSRYNQFQLFYYDFGIFSHVIWQLSRFKLPYIDHIALGHIMFLGDHFNPGLVLLAPLYWLTSDIRILLLEQAIVTTLSGYVLYKIAIKRNLGSIPSFAISLSFLIFAGTENPLVTDWHPESTAALFLLLFFYFFNFTNKKYLPYVCAVIFLSFKESNAITFFALLVWIFFINKEKRKIIVSLALISLSYFVLITRIVIPAISHQKYLYTPEFSSNPLTILNTMFNKPAKLTLIYQSFISFGFLPIFSISGLIPIMIELSQRLAPQTTIFNNLTLGQHYNVYLGVFLSLASIYAIQNIARVVKFKYTAVATALLLLLFSLYTARKITSSPINVVINNVFWSEFHPDKTTLSDLSKITKTGSVMSTNNLLPYVSTRTDSLYPFDVPYEAQNPKWIVLSTSKNQNPNNFYASKPPMIEYAINKLPTDSHYRKLNTKSTIVIYERIK